MCSSKHGLYKCVYSYGSPKIAGMFVVTGSGSVLEESYVVWPRGWGGILLEFAAMLDGISYPYAHLLYILFYFFVFIVILY